MGFPFTNKSFEAWVIEELKNREVSKNDVNTYTPFIWLSSGAHVCSGTRPESIEQTASSAVYKGCVLSNHIDIGIKYPTGNKSYLGYDLDGKLIEFDSAKRVSPPIIESMEIDTDGENNTLKIANLNIIVFSLAQLEMFELFFLRPQTTVVLEYGYNNPKTKNEVAAQSFIKGKNWKTYTDEVVKYFSPDSEKYAEQRNAYLEKIKKTNGSYDFWIGKVTNFNTNYEGADGVYRVELQISSGNELHLWMPIKQQATTEKTKATSGTTNAPQETPGPEQWMRQLCGELVLSETTTNTFLTPDAIKKYSNEFFNWGVKSESTNTENVSKNSYISFKLILDIMNSTELFKAFRQKIDYDHLTIGGENGIPVSSHPSVISTNADFIIPGSDLPLVVIGANKRSIDIDPEKKLDYTINGKKFNFPTASKNEVKSKYVKEVHIIPEGSTIGNLLNIFVNKDLFVRLFKESYAFTDFYGNILNMINDLLFGLPKLEIVKFDPDITSPQLSIIDVRLCAPPTEEIKKYRFNSDPLRSIMHDMKFGIELSNLQQAQALYESQLSVRDAKANARKDPKNKDNKTQGTAFKVDKKVLKLVGQTNSNNLYSIDWVGYQVDLIAEKKWQMKPPTDNTTNDDPIKNDEAPTDETKKLESVIKGKSIKFPAKGKTPATLIYQDYTFIQSYVVGETPGTSVLTYLECELTIDGLSGFRCGEMFNISGVPEIYNRNGAFQILNIKQSVQPDTGWRTTIHAGFRYDVK